MNKAKLSFICFFIGLAAHGEEKSSAKPSYEYRGLHAELGVVPSFGTIRDNVASLDQLVFSKAGTQLEIKIGMAVKRDIVLTFDGLSKIINEPNITDGGIKVETSHVSYVGEVNYRLGITFYSQANLFCSASAGVGRFVIQDSISKRWSHLGYSGQIEIGKYFRISKHFGVTGGVAGGFTGVDHKIDPDFNYYEHIISERISLVARITFN